MTNITQSILEEFNKNKNDSKILSLQPIQEMEEVLEQIERVREDLEQEFSDIAPSFWLYMHVIQFQVIVGELLLQSPLLHKHQTLLKSLEAKYLPGTFFSPITDSYFNLWKYFDAQVGKERETLGTLTMATAKHFTMVDPFLEYLLEKFNNSRMGIYIAESDSETTNEAPLFCKELFTGRSVKAASPSAMIVEKGDMVFMRLLPPIEKDDPEVIMTTPYFIVDTDEKMWLSFFASKKITGAVGTEEAFHHFMKYGPRRNFWSDYIIEADTGLSDNGEKIVLSGLPFKG